MGRNRTMRVFRPAEQPMRLWRLSPDLRRPRPRRYAEWSALRRWGGLPYWEVEPAGYLLRTVREEAGLSQAALGARLGITQQAVARVERWDANPTVELMRRWAAACGRTVAIRFEAEDLPPSSTARTRTGATSR
jgi:DNA-binding XRE family transcriptional regulator